MKSAATTPKLTWRLAKRGLWIAHGDEGSVYVSRTRDGWEYGTFVKRTSTFTAHDETTRPVGRAKVLAERLLGEKA